MPRRIGENWEQLIKHACADNTQLGAFRIRKAVIEQAKLLGVTSNPPSQRTVDIKVKRLRGDGSTLLPFRRVYWPESFGTPDLPWGSAPSVIEFINYYPQLGRRDGTLRPTVRAAKWFYRITLARPDAPIHSRCLMAIASAIAEVAEEKGMEPYSNRMTEGWLLFQPWIRHDEEDETGVDQRIAVYEAYQKELRYEHSEGNTLEPTDLELLEIGVLREQWGEFLALQEKQYKDRTAITKSSRED